MDRRKFIKSAGLTIPIVGLLPGVALDFIGLDKIPVPTKVKNLIQREEKADYTIRIGTGLVEVGPQHIISTTTYNGQFPGPLLRFKEGQQTIIDIYNDTDTPEQLHWHGQFVPVDVDGSAEEGTPYIAPHGMRREIFIPRPSGLTILPYAQYGRCKFKCRTIFRPGRSVYIEPEKIKMQCMIGKNF